MSRRWPLGNEVRRREITGGAMLYDASRMGNLEPAWFDPQYWISRGAVEGTARGRGAAYFVHTPERDFVLRHYRRGGLVARISQDRYFWTGENATRPFAEWHLTYHLHRAGLPVPAPLAARYRRQGRTYTGDLMTERLPGVRSLVEALQAAPLGPGGWKAVGRCIRRFHDAGVCHSDLNAHNVMLGDGEAVWLIDFDGGSLREPGLWCDANLVRLRRSLEKVTWSLPRERFAEPHWHSLLAGYRISTGRRLLRRPD